MLDRLEQDGLLSDQRFAAGLSRVKAARFGTARLKADLRVRGVAEDLIRQAVDPFAGSELERARTLYQRRFLNAPASPAERARRQRFLAGRGFSFDVIRAVTGSAPLDDE